MQWFLLMKIGEKDLFIRLLGRFKIRFGVLNEVKLMLFRLILLCLVLLHERRFSL